MIDRVPREKTHCPMVHHPLFEIRRHSPGDIRQDGPPRMDFPLSSPAVGVLAKADGMQQVRPQVPVSLSVEMEPIIFEGSPHLERFE